MPDEHDHDGPDGCLCGTDHRLHEQTEDHELPAAKGGVQGDDKPKRKRATRTAVKDDA